MPLPAFRSSRSKVRRRRSHHALKPVTVLLCKACGADILPHRACAKCGNYNGRKVKGGMEAVEKELKVKKAPVKKAKAAPRQKLQRQNKPQQNVLRDVL